MKKIIVILIILGLGWYSNQNRQERLSATSTSEYVADFFLNNCPDTKMDGDNDGVPCEKQWCH